MPNSVWTESKAVPEVSSDCSSRARYEQLGRFLSGAQALSQAVKTALTNGFYPLKGARLLSLEMQTSLLHDFGGSGPIIHLAHANGFPPGTYRLLAKSLSQGFHVMAFPLRPLWPGSTPNEAQSWHILADDLIQALDSMSMTSIIGLGHSLGAVVTMLAAVQRPDLFRAVILIDPVILLPNRLRMLGWLRIMGLDRRLPLVQKALKRRRIWPDSGACFAHFRRKELFARWSDEALHDYVASGVRERNDGQVELIYPPEWEAHIFATAPTDVWYHLPLLKTPTLIIRGEQSGTFRPSALQRMVRRLPNADVAVLGSAGHLAPMEYPDDTSKAIRSFLGYTL